MELWKKRGRRRTDEVRERIDEDKVVVKPGPRKGPTHTSPPSSPRTSPTRISPRSSRSSSESSRSPRSSSLSSPRSSTRTSKKELSGRYVYVAANKYGYGIISAMNETCYYGSLDADTSLDGMIQAVIISLNVNEYETKYTLVIDKLLSDHLARKVIDDRIKTIKSTLSKNKIRYEVKDDRCSKAAKVLANLT